MWKVAVTPAARLPQVPVIVPVPLWMSAVPRYVTVPPRPACTVSDAGETVIPPLLPLNDSWQVTFASAPLLLARPLQRPAPPALPQHEAHEAARRLRQ